MGYYVGQIVGDMTEETSTRNVIYDMLTEYTDAVEKLQHQMEAE